MMKVGGMEVVVILIVCLLVIGPERLPKVAKTLGRSLAAFKKSMNDATSELREVSDEFKEVSNEISDVQKTMKKALNETLDVSDKTTKEAKKPAAKQPEAKTEAPAAKQPEAAAESPAPAEETVAAEPAPQSAEATETTAPTETTDEQQSAAV